MIRRLFRIGLLLGLLGGLAFALTRVLGGRPAEAPLAQGRPSEPWPRLASDPAATAPPRAPSTAKAKKPAPAKKAAAKTKAVPHKTWVEPSGAACPTSHPVKAKLTSKIFHLPGMASYERTNPDRCYADAAKAEADGLRPAKR